MATVTKTERVALLIVLASVAGLIGWTLHVWLAPATMFLW